MGVGATFEEGEVRGCTIQEAVQSGPWAGSSFGGQAALPVLELSCHTFSDPSTHQANQEQYADAPTDHRQDIVLRGGSHHLHGKIREAICWGDLKGDSNLRL